MAIITYKTETNPHASLCVMGSIERARNFLKDLMEDHKYEIISELDE